MKNKSSKMGILTICASLVLSAQAYVGSAYRITIKGLGTIILLGDEPDIVSDTAQEHYNIIHELLLNLAKRSAKTVVGIQMPNETRQNYADTDSRSSMPRNRLSEAQLPENLRTLIPALYDSELKGRVTFTCSDARISRIWDIVRTKDLKPIVHQALLKIPNTEGTFTFESLNADHAHIRKKYERFIERSNRNLSPKLYQAVAPKLAENLIQAQTGCKASIDLFKRYANPDLPLAKQTIQDIISQYGEKKCGKYVKEFSAYPKQEQERIENMVTRIFWERIQLPFRDRYYTPLIHTPWIMDLFNAFTQHKANTAVFFAEDTHIHYIVNFLKSLQEDLKDDTIQFEKKHILQEQPLSRIQLEEIFGIL
jgi:hypothetical protein